MRSEKVKGQESIETKFFEVLKKIGVELSAYHGGSLNGKDIKKVMNNATHVFDTMADATVADKNVRSSTEESGHHARPPLVTYGQ